jgi:broad specificity phosphatase PhoE
MRELVDRAPGQPVIIVSHLGWIRTLAPDAPRENAGRTSLVAEDVLQRHAGPTSTPTSGSAAGEVL